MKNKGFTLIELLAAIVILGILTAVAVPNVMGILNSSKNSAYVEDAKKFVSLVEYKVRAGNVIDKPKKGKVVAVSLGIVDNSEFEKSPNYSNGGKYDKNKSMVFIHNNNGSYDYYVTLAESLNNSYRGLKEVSYDSLYTQKPKGLIQNLSSLYTVDSLSLNSQITIGSVSSDLTLQSKYCEDKTKCSVFTNSNP